MAIGDELSSIDFEAMIGGPLTAVVKAQAEAAVTSVDFIKAVGFTDEGGTEAPTMVTFEYDKAIETTAPDGTVTVEVKPFKLTVPFLTMLPIPFIRVELVTIDFNAKITSVVEREVTSEIGLSRESIVNKRLNLFLFKRKARIKTNYSYKRTASASAKIERTYSLGVDVRAVQDELPAGTERLLGILENVIKETPAETPA